MKKFLAALFLTAFALSTVAPRAAAALPRIIDPFVVDVLSGGDIAVTLDKELPEDASVSAKIGEQANLPVRIGKEHNVLSVHVPIDVGRLQKREAEYRLTLSVTQNGKTEDLGGYSTFTVYPKTIAEVKSINDVPKDIAAYVRLGESFTVKGSGLFAPPDQIGFKITDYRIDPQTKQPVYTTITAKTKSVSPDGSFFVAEFEVDDPTAADNLDVLKPGLWSFEVFVWGQETAKAGYCHVWVEMPTNLHKWTATGLALLPVGLMGFILYVLSFGIRHAHAYRGVQQSGTTGKELNSFEILLVDPASNTYSLSRLQFLIWLFVLVYAYGFVFFAKAQVSHEYTFPDLAGTEMLFLISLGTLVGSVATTTLVGQKGSGEVQPSLRDLIVHGGVVALDRVQQLLWTLVAVVIFLSILYGTAGTTASLPEIPAKMLELMGISSIGYLAGKAARKQGPVINAVTVDSDGLHISGQGLSVSAQVYVGKDQQSRSDIQVEHKSPDRPNEFADMLVVKDFVKGDTEVSAVTVRNPDGQEAKWTPPVHA